MVQIRRAVAADAEGMGRVLREIIAKTGLERASDPATLIARYIEPPNGILCSVALDSAGEAMGFQSLIRAEAGNPYNVPPGWGIIGTHISPRAHRQGVGKALFACSLAAAIDADVTQIDAHIPADNPAGLAYYSAMGFTTYREPEGVVQKVFEVTPKTPPGSGS